MKSIKYLFLLGAVLELGNIQIYASSQTSQNIIPFKSISISSWTRLNERTIEIINTSINNDIDTSNLKSNSTDKFQNNPYDCYTSKIQELQIQSRIQSIQILLAPQQISKQKILHFTLNNLNQNIINQCSSITIIVITNEDNLIEKHVIDCASKTITKYQTKPILNQSVDKSVPTEPIKKNITKTTYFIKRKLAVLALIAGAAAMYYTKTSPKDLADKLLSLTEETRKICNNKQTLLTFIHQCQNRSLHLWQSLRHNLCNGIQRVRMDFIHH